MYQKIIQLDADSCLEVTTRLEGSPAEQKTVLVIRGKKSPNEVVSTSVVISKEETLELIKALNGLL